MVITAPFQFARIPRAVWFPEWGDLVSHDVPFADGYSGTIDIEIETMTPLLIGGPRRKPTEANAGEVWPVRLPDSTYAIPGSSLQGMIRNILEIACFGKLGPWVDQRRFGVRDISRGATADALYKSRISSGGNGTTIVPKTKTGWLIRLDGENKLIPCEMSRIQHTEIQKLKIKTSKPDLLKILSRSDPYHAKKFTSHSKDAPARYGAFLGDVGEPKTGLTVNVTLDAVDSDGEKLNHNHSCGKIQYRLCVAHGTDKGTLILTGKTQGAEKWDNQTKQLVALKHTKHLEFVFHNPDRNSASTTCGHQIHVPAHVWRDFKLIHEPPKGSGQKDNPNWLYWKRDFEAGQPVPIFYVEEVDENSAPKPDTLAAMGTAFMFKLAHTNDTHQMLENSSDGHLDRGKYDLPSLIFGGFGDESENSWLSHSLKRRASFEWAKASDSITPITPQYERLPGGQFKQEFRPSASADATILLGPKPSYYPIYVRQPNSIDDLYASYTPVKKRAEGATESDVLARWVPELSGAKLWPSPVDFGAEDKWRLPSPAANYGNQTRGQTDSKETHVLLNAVPAGTRFSTKLHVHNLRKVELGALLWALTFGDKNALIGGASEKRHRVGMGKPYGMGSIKIALGAAELLANNDSETIDIAKIIDHFVKEMNDLLPVLAEEKNAQWTQGTTKPNSAAQRLSWEETIQLRALIEAAKQDPTHETRYMPLNGEQGYAKQRNGNDALPPFVPDGWELPRRQALKDIPLARDPFSGNLAKHSASSAHLYRPEVGCPVANLDGRKGEIVKIEYGVHSIRTADGQIEQWPVNSFIVSGPPDI
jgi:CRISPR-associated protein (TIGR03986 family)